MASFSERYLRFRGPKVDAEKRTILWPAWTFRVLYSETNHTQLNAFQQAILGLMRAGIVRVDDIAKWLDLSRDLVAFIVENELQGGGWLDADFKLTQQSEAQLARTEEEKEGYVFLDAVSGTLWPRFCTRLDEVEPVDRLAPYPVFRGGRDSGKAIYPYCVGGSLSEPPQPEVNELTQAYRQYRRDLNQSRSIEGDTERGFDLAAKNLRLLSNRPLAVWVWCDVYKSDLAEHGYYVTDPLGVGKASSWMRKSLDKAVQKSPPTAAFITKFMAPPVEGNLSSSAPFRAADEQVRLELMAHYPWAEQVIEFEIYLPSVLRVIYLIQQAPEISPEQLDLLNSESGKLLEALFQWLLRKWNVDASKLPPAKTRWSPDDATTIYQSMNLEVLTRKAISVLARQDYSKIYRALIRRDQPLKSLVAAAVLTTAEHVDHPLRNVTADQLGLEELLEMADRRNKSGHASGQRAQRDAALADARSALALIQLFSRWY